MPSRLLFALIAATVAVPASAAPDRLIILRHGEKMNEWQLCPTGIERGEALASNYLGKGAAGSLFAAGETPEFLTITLHTLELAAPAAATWGLPMTLWSSIPPNDSDETLGQRTREAAADLLTNPRWNGKTAVIVWEHHHIADAKLDAANADAPVTLYRLLKLDTLPEIPATWSGDNYDYFWIVAMDAASGAPKSVEIVRQTFPTPYDSVPSNEWGQPNGLTSASQCQL